MMRSFLLLTAVFCCAFAPAPFLKKQKPTFHSDLERLQGVWTASGTELHIKGDSFTYYRNGVPSITYTITVNESTNPRQYDLKGVGKYVGRDYHGIYEVQDDTLKMVSLSVNSPRPKSFIGIGRIRVLQRQPAR